MKEVYFNGFAFGLFAAAGYLYGEKGHPWYSLYYYLLAYLQLWLILKRLGDKNSQ